MCTASLCRKATGYQAYILLQENHRTFSVRSTLGKSTSHSILCYIINQGQFYFLQQCCEIESYFE